MIVVKQFNGGVLATYWGRIRMPCKNRHAKMTILMRKRTGNFLVTCYWDFITLLKIAFQRFSFVVELCAINFELAL